jgi:STE24 endopeptidase
MHVLVLIGVLVVLTTANMDPLVSARWLVVPAMVTYLAVAVAMGAFRTALSLRAIAGRPELFGHAVRRHNRLAILGQVWLVAGLGGVVLVGYGRWVLEDLRLQPVPLVGHALVFAPFIVALLLNWLLEYPFYRAMRARIAQEQLLAGAAARPGWTLREYLGYNLRHHLLFVAVPVGLILLLTDSLHLAGPYLPEKLAQTIVVGGSMLCTGAVFLAAPLLIVRIWRTGRLPAGRLRDDLQRICRQMRLKVRDLLIWRSGGMIANAGVMGLIGRVRYVLLSDALLEQMDDREIKAIFAHEAGHIVSHHLFYALLFAISSVTLCGAAGAAVEGAGLPEWAAQAVTFVLLAAAWAFGFGWISRRFERQSDVIAAWFAAPDGPSGDGRITPEGAAVFARSLERVAQLNGMSPRQWNWRHGSIARRVEYIIYLGSTAGNRRDIDRVVRGIKLALWAAALLSALLVVLAVLADRGNLLV